MNAQANGLGLRVAAAPVLDNKAVGRPAFVEADVLEAGELITTGQEERRSADKPGMVVEPRPGVYRAVKAEVACVREKAKHRPDTEVAADQQQRQLATVLPSLSDCPEKQDQRQAGRQHHRYRHQTPAGNKEQRSLQRGGIDARAES